MVTQAHSSLAMFVRSPRRVSRSKNSITVKASLQETEGIRCNDFRILNIFFSFSFSLHFVVESLMCCDCIHSEMALMPSALWSWRRLRLEEKNRKLTYQGKRSRN